MGSTSGGYRPGDIMMSTTVGKRPEEIMVSTPGGYKPEEILISLPLVGTGQRDQGRNVKVTAIAVVS